METNVTASFEKENDLIGISGIGTIETGSSEKESVESWTSYMETDCVETFEIRIIQMGTADTMNESETAGTMALTLPRNQLILPLV